MKKLLCLLLSLCLMLPLAACGVDDPQVTTTATATNEIALKDMPLRIGVLYTGKATEADTGSYAIHQELIKAMRRLGLNEAQDVIVQELVPELTNDVLKAVDKLVESGALIIFGTALGYNEGMSQAADKYPNVVFCQMGGLNGNDYNFITYFAPLYQAYYMLGAAAAMKARELDSELIGFISTSGKETPEAAAIINAFTRGVQVYLPSATVCLRVLDPGATEAMEMAAVDDLYQIMGCKVFGAFTHTAGTLRRAAGLGLYATGPWFALDPQRNQSLLSAQLAAPQLRWFGFFMKALKSVGDCTWADDFAMAMDTTHFYGTYQYSTIIAPTSDDSLHLTELGSCCAPQTSQAMGALSPQETYRVLPVVPDETDGPNATIGTTLVPNIVQGPFAGFLYNITFNPNGSTTTNYPAALVDVDGNVRVSAGEVGMEVNEIREMDYYIMGIEVV